jgi:sensor domain CHASE-containing protein
MDTQSLFYIGIILGFLAGVLLTLIGVKTKSLFSSSEARRLRQEKQALEKRLHEKDKYIDEMMGHAEKLAHNFKQHKNSEVHEP